MERMEGEGSTVEWNRSRENKEKGEKLKTEKREEERKKKKRRKREEGRQLDGGRFFRPWLSKSRRSGWETRGIDSFRPLFNLSKRPDDTSFQALLPEELTRKETRVKPKRGREGERERGREEREVVISPLRGGRERKEREREKKKKKKGMNGR